MSACTRRKPNLRTAANIPPLPLLPSLEHEQHDCEARVNLDFWHASRLLIAQPSAKQGSIYSSEADDPFAWKSRRELVVILVSTEMLDGELSVKGFCSRRGMQAQATRRAGQRFSGLDPLLGILRWPDVAEWHGRACVQRHAAPHMAQPSHLYARRSRAPLVSAVSLDTS